MAANSASQKIQCTAVIALATGAGVNSVSGPCIGNVIVDVEAAQRFDQEQRQEKQHHPAAGRIVSDLAIRFAPQQARQMLDSAARGDATKPANRAVALPKKPQSTRKTTSVEHRFAGARVPVHPIEPPGHVSRHDQRRGQPMKQRGSRCPRRALCARNCLTVLARFGDAFCGMAGIYNQSLPVPPVRPASAAMA